MMMSGRKKRTEIYADAAFLASNRVDLLKTGRTSGRRQLRSGDTSYPDLGKSSIALIIRGNSFVFALSSWKTADFGSVRDDPCRRLENRVLHRFSTDESACNFIDLQDKAIPVWRRCPRDEGGLPEVAWDRRSCGFRAIAERLD
jgi:hypothetical protein